MAHGGTNYEDPNDELKPLRRLRSVRVAAAKVACLLAITCWVIFGCSIWLEPDDGCFWCCSDHIVDCIIYFAAACAAPLLLSVHHFAAHHRASSRAHVSMASVVPSNDGYAQTFTSQPQEQHRFWKEMCSPSHRFLAMAHAGLVTAAFGLLLIICLSDSQHEEIQLQIVWRCVVNLNVQISFGVVLCFFVQLACVEEALMLRPTAMIPETIGASHSKAKTSPRSPPSVQDIEEKYEKNSLPEICSSQSDATSKTSSKSAEVQALKRLVHDLQNEMRQLRSTPNARGEADAMPLICLAPDREEQSNDAEAIKRPITFDSEASAQSSRSRLTNPDAVYGNLKESIGNKLEPPSSPSGGVSPSSRAKSSVGRWRPLFKDPSIAWRPVSFRDMPDQPESSMLRGGTPEEEANDVDDAVERSGSSNESGDDTGVGTARAQANADASEAIDLAEMGTDSVALTHMRRKKSAPSSPDEADRRLSAEHEALSLQVRQAVLPDLASGRLQATVEGLSVSQPEVSEVVDSTSLLNVLTSGDLNGALRHAIAEEKVDEASAAVPVVAAPAVSADLLDKTWCANAEANAAAAKVLAPSSTEAATSSDNRLEKVEEPAQDLWARQTTAEEAVNCKEKMRERAEQDKAEHARAFEMATQQLLVPRQESKNSALSDVSKK